MTRDPPAESALTALSTEDPAAVEVLLLGTYHMDNPGLDEVNVEADDVLEPDRQAELRDLTDRIAGWDPDLVCVERPYDHADEVNARYREYRDGERAYDREEAFPAPHPDRNDPVTECRSEVVQVAFRLADRLGHDRVAPFDERPDPPEDDPFEDREIESARKTDVAIPDPEDVQREADRRLGSMTIPAYLGWLNQPGTLRFNHAAMFDAAIRAADRPFGSPASLASWYDRNIRMVHHLWDAMDPGTERLVVVVGSGHVRVLEQLLTEASMFVPRRATELLPTPGK